MAKILKSDNLESKIISSPIDDNLTLSTKPGDVLTTRLTILSGGNIGIGVSPSTKLHVEGGRTTLSADNESLGLQLNNSSTLNGPFLGSSGSDIFIISTSGGTERFRITASGGVSFGTGGTNFGSSNQVLISGGDTPPSWGLIANANVSASAAITYSKLSLTGSIVNNDISASAAIAVSKLSASTISGITLGNNLNALTIGTGLSLSSGTTYNGSTAVTLTNSGVTSIAGTTNQVTVSGTGSVTLSLPQSINTSASIQFGSIGIGTPASGTTGEIRATNDITAFYGLSDKRLKENIFPLENVLSKLKNINGYNFNYKTRPNQKMIGVIAQELLQEYPELVYETSPVDEGTGLEKTYAVRYELLTAILLQAVKELSDKVYKLENE